jgi:hypothetical protein
MKPTNSDSKNFYSLVPNYAALRELEERHYHKPTEEEIQRFLLFWDEVYQIWRNRFPEKLDRDKLMQKVRTRKLLNEMSGLKLD